MSICVGQSSIGVVNLKCGDRIRGVLTCCDKLFAGKYDSDSVLVVLVLLQVNSAACTRAERLVLRFNVQLLKDSATATGYEGSCEQGDLMLGSQDH